MSAWQIVRHRKKRKQPNSKGKTSRKPETERRTRSAKKLQVKRKCVENGDVPESLSPTGDINVECHENYYETKIRVEWIHCSDCLG